MLVVGGSGRTGSTMIMAMLAAMPAVAFDRQPPYEVLHLTHLARLAATWSEPSPQPAPSTEVRARIRRLIERDVLPRVHRERRGHVNTTAPTGGDDVHARRIRGSHLLDGDHQQQALDRRFLGDGWTTLAAALAEGHRAEMGATARWYAEKPPLWLVDALDGVVDHRVIARVRDPRDAFCSHRAFFRRRHPTHGRQRGERDDLAYIRRFAQQQLDYARWLAPRSDSTTLRVIRYEDAVREPLATARELASWLDVVVETDAATTHLARSEESHGTSGGAVASMGRWQSDLSAPERAVAAEAFAEALELLGYEP